MPTVLLNINKEKSLGAEESVYQAIAKNDIYLHLKSRGVWHQKMFMLGILYMHITRNTKLLTDTVGMYPLDLNLYDEWLEKIVLNMT